MNRIELRQINKRYPQAPSATIKGVDLDIGRGEFCVVVGPSGCGKSTLLRMVAGLEGISSGELLIDGAPMTNVEPSRRGVAMVFQSYALYPHMTVEENMAFGLRMTGGNSSDVARKVRSAADALQLTPLLDRLPRELSGGQRQRVAIGRAIVRQPKVFLFDEPLSNLDAALRVQTRLEIARLHRELGDASMMYVTHDQVEAMTLADKIVLLHNGAHIERQGSIAQIGTPMDLYHRPASRFVAEFIGSPGMNMLPAKLVAANDHVATLDVMGQRVAACVDARQLLSHTPVWLGVRPEHTLPAASGGTAALPGTISHMERLGDMSMLYVDLGPGMPMLTMRQPGSVQPAVGSRIDVLLVPEHLHVFDEHGKACRRTVTLPA